MISMLLLIPASAFWGISTFCVSGLFFSLCSYSWFLELFFCTTMLDVNMMLLVNILIIKVLYNNILLRGGVLY